MRVLRSNASFTKRSDSSRISCFDISRFLAFKTNLTPYFWKFGPRAKCCLIANPRADCMHLVANSLEMQIVSLLFASGAAIAEHAPIVYALPIEFRLNDLASHALRVGSDDLPPNLEPNGAAPTGSLPKHI